MKHSTTLPLGGLFLLISHTIYSQNGAQHGNFEMPVTSHYFSQDLALQYPVGSELNASTWPGHEIESTSVDGNRLGSYSFSNHGQKRVEGVSGYSTSLGLRGGYTSGITLKHFVKSNAALEFILGTRWEGFSFSLLYEWHTPNAFNTRQLTWVYGLGARVGNYRGDRYYRSGPGNCNNPNDRRCGSYWGNRNLTAVGIVGIGGLEFKFDEIPITISLDLMPVLYLNYWGGTFFDGSLAVRYILK